MFSEKQISGIVVAVVFSPAGPVHFVLIVVRLKSQL
jgi:hypothetical protein